MNEQQENNNKVIRLKATPPELRSPQFDLPLPDGQHNIQFLSLRASGRSFLIQVKGNYVDKKIMSHWSIFDNLVFLAYYFKIPIQFDCNLEKRRLVGIDFDNVEDELKDQCPDVPQQVPLADDVYHFSFSRLHILGKFFSLVFTVNNQQKELFFDWSIFQIQENPYINVNFVGRVRNQKIVSVWK